MELVGSHRALRPVDPLLDLRHEWVDLGSCAVRSQLLGSMPSEGSVHVRSIEHARPKRLAHGAHAGHDSTRIIRTSKALPHTPSAGLGRVHPAFVRRAPIASRSIVCVTSPAPCPRPRLCRAAVVLLLGLARPARRPTRRPCLGHVVSQPRPAAPTPPGHPTDRRRHLRRNDRETEGRPDPAHRDGHQRPVLGPQYPHPPDSGTHLHRDHPTGLGDHSVAPSVSHGSR